MRIIVYALLMFSSGLFPACRESLPTSVSRQLPEAPSDIVERPKLSEIPEPLRRVLESANLQTTQTRSYDPSYVVIPYPNGDVAKETGVCTDVVIRGFRNAGIDLQKAVHEDMAGNFKSYPSKWGLSSPDTNIDHRRAPNLQTYFKRSGKELPITQRPDDYAPGDVVSWDLDGKGMTHIGIVSNMYNSRSGRPLIIHNIGGGTQREDRLFDWKITGHYRYF